MTTVINREPSERLTAKLDKLESLQHSDDCVTLINETISENEPSDGGRLAVKNREGRCGNSGELLELVRRTVQHGWWARQGACRWSWMGQPSRNSGVRFSHECCVVMGKEEGPSGSVRLRLGGHCHPPYSSDQVLDVIHFFEFD